MEAIRFATVSSLLTKSCLNYRWILLGRLLDIVLLLELLVRLADNHDRFGLIDGVVLSDFPSRREGLLLLVSKLLIIH